jgi:hypothetical protein
LLPEKIIENRSIIIKKYKAFLLRISICGRNVFCFMPLKIVTLFNGWKKVSALDNP